MALNRSALGKRIQIQRKRKDMSQTDLADIIGKTTPFMSYIENGTKSLSLDTFVDMVNALETTPNELLRESVDLNKEDIAISLADELGECTEAEKQLLVEVVQAVRAIFPQQKEKEKKSFFR
ncbi:MAG: helix-turn-helix transcriptional regulator [Oscillospiraceae bacterium]|nr:helix-turn-helix transcriptional regulator [Oscillospiraceae bacterium]